MTVTITSNDENQRVDKFLKRILNDAPLSFINSTGDEKNG